MCGIVYARRTDGKPARKQVYRQYVKQNDRGVEGFGYVSVKENGTIGEYKRTQKEKDIRKLLKANEDSHILFHHRYPTSTVNVPESAHPIVVKNSELKNVYYVVHNGVISNHKELQTEHERMGYKYTTEVKTMYQTAKGTLYTGDSKTNDSEALAIELARTIEGLQPKCRAQGSIAYIALQVRNKKAIAVYYGTNGGNDLTIRESAQGIMIASEGGEKIIDGIAYRLNLETNETELADIPLVEYPRYVEPAQPYTGYKYNASGYITSQDEEDYIPATASETDRELMNELEMLGADIEIAKQANEFVEAQELQERYDEISDEMYARKVDAYTSNYQRELGFHL